MNEPAGFRVGTAQRIQSDAGNAMNDDLKPARGLMWGILGGFFLWVAVAIGALWWMA